MKRKNKIRSNKDDKIKLRFLFNLCSFKKYLSAITLVFFLGCQEEDIFYTSFIHLKIIDLNGHPVAGAQIIKKNKTIGNTNSFGEWSQVVNFDKNKPNTLIIQKLINDELIIVREKFIEQEEKEIRKDHKIYRQISLISKEKSNKGNRNHNISMLKSLYESLYFKINKNNIFSIQDKSILEKDDIRKRDILKHLNEISKNSGLKVKKESAWQIILEDMKIDSSICCKIKNTEEFIKITSHLSLRKKSIFSFLIKVSEDSIKTSLNILTTLKNHIEYPYHLVKEKNKWYVLNPIETSKKNFWKIDKGFTFLDQDNKHLFFISTDKNISKRKKILLSSTTKDFLEENIDTSYLFKNSYTSQIQKRQKKAYIKLSSDASKELELYVSGIQAKRIKGLLWVVDKPIFEFANITVVNDKKIVFRQRVRIKSGERTDNSKFTNIKLNKKHKKL